MKIRRILAAFMAVAVLFSCVVPDGVSLAATKPKPYIVYNNDSDQPMYDGSSATMRIGQEVLVRTYNFSGTIRWSSSNENVVVVQSGAATQGRLVANGGGKCKITIMDSQGQKMSFKLNVSSFKVSSYISVGVGGKMKLYEGKAKGKIKIKNFNKDIFSVSKKGMVKGKKVGEGRVRVKAEGVEYFCDVMVNEASFNEYIKDGMIKTGNTFTIPFSGADPNKCTVKVDNSSVISFNGLTGTGLRQGYTNYTVTYNDSTYGGVIYVLDNEADFAVGCPSDITIKVGQSYKVPCFGAWTGDFHLRGSNAAVCSVPDFESNLDNDGINIINNGEFSNECWYSSFTIIGEDEGDCEIRILSGTDLMVKLNVTVTY